MKTAKYAIAMILVLAFTAFIAVNDITVSNWQGKVSGMFGGGASGQIEPYDESFVAAEQICGGMAEEAGRILADFEVRAGFRPSAAVPSDANIKVTDSFLCVFTSGETIPFMITYVGGKIVNIQ